MDYQRRSHYTYYPLPPIANLGRTPPCTRLFLLDAGQYDDPLSGNLSIYQLEPEIVPVPPYEALSYVWGTAPAQTSILIDGQSLGIKPNLEAALRHLRLPTQARRLWVDALCIDQSNVDERTRQVKYMRFVYKYATRVIVWLGPWEPGVKRAFELAERLASVPTTLPTVQRQTAVGEILIAASEAYGNLCEIFDREYFVRSWCLQETVVCKWAVAKCGESEMNFLHLLEALPTVSFKRNQLFPEKPFEAWYNMVSVWRRQPSLNSTIDGSAGTLLILLGATRDFKATDPRDKVFALLGISDEGLEPILTDRERVTRRGQRKAPLPERLFLSLAQKVKTQINKFRPDVDFLRSKALQPNYSKGIVELYRDLTRFFIARAPQELDVLSHVQHVANPTEGPFPSWVPKWFEARSCRVLATGFFFAGYPKRHARTYIETRNMRVDRPVAQPNSLYLGGFIVDRVKAVSTVMWYHIDSSLPFEELWNQMFEFPLSRVPVPVYRDGSHLALALAVTLLAGEQGSFMGDSNLVTEMMQKKDPKAGSYARERFAQQARADSAAYLLANHFSNTSDARVDEDQVSSVADNLRALSQEAEAHGGNPGNVDKFEREAKILSHNRRFYLTESGYMGIGPKMMRMGDEVCVLYGGRAPFILRRMQDHHIFVGNAFLNDGDIMWGKTAREVKSGKKPGTTSVMFELR